MSKGISEKFDEHEQDTAPRAYPREIVEGTKRTTKMARIDPAEIRTESGTRPILTHDAIERHVREKSDAALTPAFEDPHSRPTIERGFIDLPPESAASGWATSAPISSSAAVSLEPPVVAGGVHQTTRAPRRYSFSGGVLAGLLVVVLFVVSAAGAVGFVLGRRSASR